MDRLPGVLQNEIAEFARGDRKFFKSQFNKVVDQLEVRIEVAERYDRKQKVKVLLRKDEGRYNVSPHHHSFMKYLRTTRHSLYTDDGNEYSAKYRIWVDWLNR